MEIEAEKVVIGRSKDGALSATPDDAGRMLKQHWSEVFTARPVDEERMKHFLRYSVEAPPSFDCHIGGGVIASAIVRTLDSRPGPDGVPYAAWR